tara:strand:- start:1905 stop:3179 length:1275 start_codon:yes stop_codon:yes gene_type:complete
MYKIIFLVVSLLFSAELPQGLTDWELDNMHIIDEMRFRTEPPPPPVRAIAEYEPMQGVLIRYPFGISTSLIREMAEDVKIYCLVSSGSQNSAYNSMNNAGVDMGNVEFILGSTNSYWTRDYGPWWVIDGNGEYAIVDFTYNRPRPSDNQAPYKVSQHLDVPYYSADFVATGGNYMTDGFGIAASAHIAYTENDECNTNNDYSIPLPPCAYVDNIMDDYYGINTFHVVADPNNEYIDHIDCWGKFLSPTKILIRSVQSSNSQYQEIEAVASYFESAVNSEGVPWEVFRVYTPSGQPYTNSLILNDKVFVPMMNSNWDDEAIEVYQTALPDHEILGFTSSGGPSWQSTDALHCRVRGIPDLTYFQFDSGDVNLDELLNIQDVVLIINYILGSIEFDSNQLSLADLNSDSMINVQDVILLINLILEN